MTTNIFDLAIQRRAELGADWWMPKAAEPVAPAEDPTLFGEFRKGLSSGIDSTQAAGYGLLSLAANAAGADQTRDKLLQGYLRNMREAEDAGIAVQSIADINDVGDGALYVAQGLGQLAPSIVGSIASGGLGYGAVRGAASVAGRKAGEVAAKQVGQELVEKSVVDAVAREAAGKVLARGALAGSAGFEGATIAGDTFGVNAERGDYSTLKALGSGVVGGALGAIPDAGVINAALRLGKGGILSQAAKTALAEGGTEAAQEATQRLFTGQSLTENPMAYADSFALGAVGGGLVGGAARAVGGERADESAGDALQNAIARAKNQRQEFSNLRGLPNANTFAMGDGSVTVELPNGVTGTSPQVDAYLRQEQDATERAIERASRVDSEVPSFTPAERPRQPLALPAPPAEPSEVQGEFRSLGRQPSPPSAEPIPMGGETLRQASPEFEQRLLGPEPQPAARIELPAAPTDNSQAIREQAQQLGIEESDRRGLELSRRKKAGELLTNAELGALRLFEERRAAKPAPKIITDANAQEDADPEQELRQIRLAIEESRARDPKTQQRMERQAAAGQALVDFAKFGIERNGASAIVRGDQGELTPIFDGLETAKYDAKKGGFVFPVRDRQFVLGRLQQAQQTQAAEQAAQRQAAEARNAAEADITTDEQGVVREPTLYSRSRQPVEDASVEDGYNRVDALDTQLDADVETAVSRIRAIAQRELPRLGFPDADSTRAAFEVVNGATSDSALALADVLPRKLLNEVGELTRRRQSLRREYDRLRNVSAQLTEENLDAATDVAIELGQAEGYGALPISKAARLEDIMAEIDPRIRMESLDRKALEGVARGTKVWIATTASGAEATIVEQPRGRIYIDVSRLTSGKGAGSVIYHAVANYAYNNDKTFIGDPNGLSDTGLIRRTQNMLNAALRFGTTRHLEPHQRQRDGNEYLRVPPLDWRKGDDRHNIRELIRSVSTTMNETPGSLSDGMYYNTETGTFVTKKGEQLTREQLAERAENAKSPLRGKDADGVEGGSGVLPGAERRDSFALGRTVARQAVLNTVLQKGIRGARDQVVRNDAARSLVERSEGLRAAGLAGSPLEGIGYSRGGRDSGEVSRDAGGQDRARGVVNRAKPVDAVAARKILEARFGKPVVAALERAGVLRIFEKQREAAPGAEGKVKGFARGEQGALVAENLTEQDVVPVVLHELGSHLGIERMMDDADLAAMDARLTKLRDSEADAAIIEEADARVNDELELRAEEGGRLTPEQARAERIAYTVQVAAEKMETGGSVSPSMRALVRDFIGKVKAWLLTQDGFLKLPEAARKALIQSMTAQDFVALAVRAVNVKAESATRGNNPGAVDATDAAGFQAASREAADVGGAARGDAQAVPGPAQAGGVSAGSRGGRGVPGGSGVLAGERGQGDRLASEGDSEVTPLPGYSEKMRGIPGPDPKLVAVAEEYARENGIGLRRQAEYAPLDAELALSLGDPYGEDAKRHPAEARARRLADAYGEMPHAPQDPRVKEAYANMIRQTEAQYRALEKAGYKFWLFGNDNDPYAGNPASAMRDLRANQSMGVYSTAAGFGSDASFDPADNPLLALTDIEWPNGSPNGPLVRVHANDLFRAVHDAFGHGLEGAGFRARGEENAWQAHARLFTGSALGAMTSETRGQNSRLNFGPYGRSNLSAKLEETHFSDQKTGLMPEWTWTEGRVSDELATDSAAFKRWFGDSKVVDADGKPLRVYHATSKNFDQFRGDNGVDLGFHFGTAEQANARDANLPTDRKTTMIVPAYLSIKNPLRVSDAGYFSVQNIDDNKFVIELQSKGVRALPGMSNKELVAEIEAAGYDGLVYENESEAEGDSYVALRPEQIKSATGNNGNFDPTDPRIQYSRTGQRRAPIFAGQPQLGLGEETLAQRLTRRFVDNMNRVQQAQDYLRSKGVVIDDGSDVVTQETLFYGATGEQLRQFEKRHAKPIMDLLKSAEKNGLGLREADDYLIALHAEERNREVAKRNPGVTDGSGMSDAEARKIKAQYAGEQKRQLDQIAQAVRAMLDENMDRMRSAGLMEDAVLNEWQRAYKNYVPLKTVDEDGESPGTGTGFDIRGKESKVALGRGSRATSPILVSMIDVQRTITRAGKARVGRAVLKLAEQDKTGDLFEVKEIGDFRTTVYNSKNKQAQEAVDFQAAQDAFAVKVGGTVKYVVVKDRILSDQLKKIGAPHDLNVVMDVVSKGTRFLSKMLTQYSPQFTLVNGVRDAITGAINAMAYDGIGAKKVLAGLPKAWAAIASENFGTGKSAAWSQLYKDFLEDGASSAGFGLDTIKDIQQRALREMNLNLGQQTVGTGKQAWNASMRGLSAVADTVSRANEVVENATRLSVYAAARRAGDTRQQAALKAKEITVNFNKKGEWGSQINGAFMFFNAAVQGNRALYQHAAKSPKVKAALFGLGITGFMLEAINQAMGDDDETGDKLVNKISDYEKDHSAVLFIGDDGERVKLPLPYGFNVAFVAGRRLFAMLNGQESPQKTALGVIGAFYDAFMPLGGGGEGLTASQEALRTLTPTLATGLFDISVNRDNFGKPIARERYGRADANTPDSQLYFRGVSPMSRQIAEWVNEATGGSKVRAGVIDVNPEYLDYWTRFVAGGLGSTVLGATQMAGEERSINRTPVLKSFYGTEPEYYLPMRFNQVREETDVLEGRMRDRDGELTASELRVARVSRAVNLAINRLNKRRRAMEDAGRDTELVEKQIEQQQKRLIRAYNLAAQKAEAA